MTCPPWLRFNRSGNVNELATVTQCESDGGEATSLGSVFRRCRFAFFKEVRNFHANVRLRVSLQSLRRLAAAELLGDGLRAWEVHNFR